MSKTIQEMIEVMQAFDNGQEIESIPVNFTGYLWKKVTKPAWDWYDNDYRIKEHKPMDIPWDIINPKYNYAAMDKDTEIFLYENEPEIEGNVWITAPFRIISNILNINTNNITWDKSLQKRPDIK